MVVLLAMAALAADIRYVQASTLNLRAEPAKTARALGALPIGSPVTVLGPEVAPFVRVRVASGREGWVDATFLASKPLTGPEALSRARAAATPAERLAWAQRAAAIDPSAENLGELEAAYRAAGDAVAADRVGAERRWPHTIFPAAPGGVLEVEWSGAEMPVPTPQSGEVAVPLRALRDRGVDPDGRWWVLPDEGPPIEVKLASAAISVLNECGGSWGLVLRFDGRLPDGRVPVAFTSATPPASWSAGPATPPIPRDTASAAAKSAAADRTWATPEIALVALPDAWFVRVVQETGTSAESDATEYGVVDLRVDSAGARVVYETNAASFVPPDAPTVSRDVNGDGTADVVWRSSCSTAITTAEGARLAAGHDRCCGC